MKLMLLCYVVPVEHAPSSSSRSSFSSTVLTDNSSLPLSNQLAQLVVKPVCVTVRRAIAIASQYETVDKTQQKHSVACWSKKPNQSGEKWTRGPAAMALVNVGSHKAAIDSVQNSETGNKADKSGEQNSTPEPASAPAGSVPLLPGSRKMKVRRDPLEVRAKSTSKYAKIWKKLKSDTNIKAVSSTEKSAIPHHSKEA